MGFTELDSELRAVFVVPLVKTVKTDPERHLKKH